MSHLKLEISVSERLILDYIGFRTKSGFPFFEKNSTIAPNVGLTEGTTKELIIFRVFGRLFPKRIGKKEFQKECP